MLCKNQNILGCKAQQVAQEGQERESSGWSPTQTETSCRAQELALCAGLRWVLDGQQLPSTCLPSLQLAVFMIAYFLHRPWRLARAEALLEEGPR